MGLFRRRNSKEKNDKTSKLTQQKTDANEGRIQHNNEISNQFIAGTSWNDKDLYGLTIQDLCILIVNSKWARDNHIFVSRDEEMAKLIDHFYETLINKIKSCERIYTVIDETTGYPFIDEDSDNSIWLFSEKKYADNASDFYVQRYRKFRVEEINKNNIIKLLQDMFYLAGAAGVYIDNGLAGCMIKREDLVQTPDWTGTPNISIPVMNPDLMLAHLKMTQELGWGVNYNNREQKLDRYELELSKQSVKAKLLVPLSQPTSGDSTAVFKKDANISLPVLTGKNGSKAIPAFTDWKQFGMRFNDKEYGGLILSFHELMEMVEFGSDYDAFVINIGKCPLEVNSKSIKRIKTVLSSSNEQQIIQ